VIIIVALFLWAVLSLVDALLGTSAARGVGAIFGSFWSAFRIASFLALAGIFFGMAQYFIFDAVKRVSDRERVRHWKYDPNPRLSRRRPRPGES
jgi:cell division protein FtsW (lipid II flippase)